MTRSRRSIALALLGVVVSGNVLALVLDTQCGIAMTAFAIVCLAAGWLAGAAAITAILRHGSHGSLRTSPFIALLAGLLALLPTLVVGGLAASVHSDFCSR
jgi:hypothetical protein